MPSQGEGGLIRYGRFLNFSKFTWALIREGHLKEAGCLFKSLRYMVWIKSYLHVNTNVEISCLSWNNLGIINCIENVSAKPNSMGLKSLQIKFQLPPHKDERKHSLFVTFPSVKKWSSLVPNIFITLTATATKH